jgi:hypothetical protein
MARDGLHHLDVGDRVKVMPHSDFFMMGEASGSVIAKGRKHVTVKGERSGAQYKFNIDGDSLEYLGRGGEGA